MWLLMARRAVSWFLGWLGEELWKTERDSQRQSDRKCCWVQKLDLAQDDRYDSIYTIHMYKRYTFLSSLYMHSSLFCGNGQIPFHCTRSLPVPQQSCLPRPAWEIFWSTAAERENEWKSERLRIRKKYSSPTGNQQYQLHCVGQLPSKWDRGPREWKHAPSQA